jgi:hypothetical protein
VKAVLAVGVTALLAVAVAGAADRPAKRIDRDSATGANAAVNVSGERKRPRKFVLKLATEPAGMAVGGSASLSCRDKQFNFADRTRDLAEVAPATVSLRPTKRRAAACSVTVNAGSDFGGGEYGVGTLTATLLYKRRK